MTFKRNILTILYTVLFLLIAGFGLFQMTNLTVSTTSNKYLVTGILVFGLIIYLIVAFFLKKADILRPFQEGKILFFVLELIFFMFCNGLTFYFNWAQHGMVCAVIVTLLLICQYATARLCGGRLCGLLSLAVGFYFIMRLVPTDMIQINSAIDVLCFLIPFMVFLGIQQIYVPMVGDHVFFVISSYLVLGFVFSLAIALNPLVLVLFAGCVFSLLFSAPQKESISVLTRGVCCAAYLVLFTVAFLFCIHLLTPDIFSMPSFELDHGLPLDWNVDTLDYIIGKYARPLLYLYLPFQYGIFPTVLFFFAVLAGYYTIQKKSSYMGPALLSFVAMFVYYIFCCKGGSQFYYLTYFLPLFASYGFSNTLIADAKPVVSALDSATSVELPEEFSDEEMDKIVKMEEAEGMEEVKKEMKRGEKADFESDETKKVEVAPVPENGEIPEWTIPEEFLNQEENVEQEGEMPEEDTATILENIPVAETETPENTLDLDQFEPEPMEFVTDQLVAEETEVEQKENMDQLGILPELDLPSENDIEQFVSEAVQSTGDGVLDPASEETQLNDLLDRLDMSEPIKRMNESAQEDIADVIEREEEQVELSEALPLKPSKSTLPKYQKPNFDFDIEPVNIPLDDQYSNISEYDEVPTIHDLESQWKSDSKPVIETVATKVEESEKIENGTENPMPAIDLSSVHSEEVVRKTGIVKRSYHKITIR